MAVDHEVVMSYVERDIANEAIDSMEVAAADPNSK